MEDIFDKIKKYTFENNTSIKKLCREAGVSKSALYRRSNYAIKKILAYIGGDEAEPPPESIEKEFGKTIVKFLDKKTGKFPDWREWFKHAQQHQKLHQDISRSQDIANLEIKTENEYIGIVFSADWHLGSISVDYDMLQKNIEFLLETENIFLITVGDLTDNFVNFRSVLPILSQIFAPAEQVQVLSGILTDLARKEKWLAACWGNHDIERDEKLIGYSAVKALLSEKMIYFNGKGLLKIKFKNGPEYIIALTHTATGYSIYNPTHANIRIYREFFPADVIVTGHKHFPAFQYFPTYPIAKDADFPVGGDVFFIQTGTAKIDDGFSKRFFNKGIFGMPTLILNTREKEMTVVKSPQFALKLL